MTPANDDPCCLFWIDLETTGLDPARDLVLECAYQVTSFAYPFSPLSKLRTVLTLATDEDVTEAYGLADEKVREMHDAGGLWRDLRLGRSESEPATTIPLLEADLLALSDGWPTGKSKPLLAGSSVHFDMAFLRRYMPRFAARLSYRIFDVSAAWMVLRSTGMQYEKAISPHRAGSDLAASQALAHACASWATQKKGAGV